MRIIYDDREIKKVCEYLDNFICWDIDIESISEQDYGSMRCQRHLFKKYFNTYLSERNMLIGKTATHANGIGNNNKYPIYYLVDDNNMEICGYININSGLYSEIYVSICDYNDDICSKKYEITPNKVKVN